MPLRLAIAGLGAALCGCNAPAAVVGPATRTVFDNASWEAVLDAGERTMREFFTVDRVDRRGGVIRALPTPEPPAARSGGLGPSLSSPAELRKRAELALSRRGNGVEAACRVLIQRNEAAEDRPFARQGGTEDLPNQTPLEESLGIESGPGVSWRTIGRDRGLEQAVLAALRERLERD